jgi:MerR family transcriptional regulator, multidrug-efflux activator
VEVITTLYKVKEVSELAGVSVRSLHHYDSIGLLVPAESTAAGYRLYTEKDLERLQQILFFKEMDFSLQEINNILSRSDFDRKATLEKHKELLLAKKCRLEDLIITVDKTINSIGGGNKMADKEMFKGFDMSEIEEHQNKYSKEAKEKYGNETVEKVEKRTSAYTSEDWGNIQAKTEDIYRRVMERMVHGPEDLRVQQAVADLRQFITDHYYDCTIDIFRGLGDLYVADRRFTKSIDKHGEGLAAFLSKAMHYYCDQQTK